jgi:DNA-binding MarR family transcriptional regulator
MSPRQRRTDVRVHGFDSLEQKVFLEMWRTYERLRLLEENVFSGHDLTPQQYNVLRLLWHARPEAVKTLELASRLVSRAPDITRILDGLERRGLVRRDRPAANRRVVELRITPAGEALIEELREPLVDCHAEQLGHLSTKDLMELSRLLRAARELHESPESPWRR